MFVCAGESEQFEFAKSIGIGLVSSAIGLTRLCLQHAPKEIVFLGSAGSYNPEWSILDMAYSTCATQLELSFLDHHSYTPLDNSIQLNLTHNVSCETINTHWHKKIESLPQVLVNSSNYITNTSRYNARMNHIGITLENMEFFSVLKVAQYFQIPCIGIFCVSNFIGASSHDEFLKNHEKVKEKIHKFITEQ